jgi:hypothetical protein
MEEACLQPWPRPWGGKLNFHEVLFKPLALLAPGRVRKLNDVQERESADK